MKASEVRIIVDAGPLIGWLNASDQWHSWSVRVLSGCRGVLHTTEIVLGEACWHLGGNTKPVHALLSLVRRRAIVPVRLWPEYLPRTQELMLKFEEMDPADASLVAMSEIYPKAKVVTTDSSHFQVYRRVRNQRLPLVVPD